MDKKNWNEMLNKGRLEELDDPTTYELDLGQGKKFIVNKKNKSVQFLDGKNTIQFGLSVFKKIFNFAKKNGAI